MILPNEIFFSSFTAADGTHYITKEGIGRGPTVILETTIAKPDRAKIRAVLRPYIKAARLLDIKVSGETGGL